jgi:heme a synthase
MNMHEWQNEFNRYKQSPEFRKINSDFNLAEFQSIYWWEYAHRLLGRFVGAFYLLPLLLFLLQRKLSRNMIGPLLAGLMLIVSQGVLGWIMVRSGLKEVPHVNHFLLAAHFALAIGTLLFLFRVLLRLNYVTSGTTIDLRFRRLAMLTTVLIGVQLIVGALVAGLKAGLIYNTYPRMGEYWIAPDVFNSSAGFIANGASLQFLHRYFALIILVAACLQFIVSGKSVLPADLRHANNIFIGIIILQIGLGITCLLLQAPIVAGVAHQLCGVLTVLLAFFIAYRSKQYSNADYRIKQQT